MQLFGVPGALLPDCALGQLHYLLLKVGDGAQRGLDYLAPAQGRLIGLGFDLGFVPEASPGGAGEGGLLVQGEDLLQERLLE